MPLRRRTGMTSPRATANWTTRSSSRPKLPLGFVSESRRARTWASINSEGVLMDLTVVLSKFEDGHPGHAMCDPRVDRQMRYDSRWLRPVADDLESAIDTQHKVLPSL